MTEPEEASPGQPLIVLKGLEGNPPASERSSIQQVLAPHVDLLVVFWWGAWFSVLSLMLFRTFVLPLLKRERP